MGPGLKLGWLEIAGDARNRFSRDAAHILLSCTKCSTKDVLYESNINIA